MNTICIIGRPILCEGLRAILDRNGYDISVVTDVRDVPSRIPPDLVLLEAEKTPPPGDVKHLQALNTKIAIITPTPSKANILWCYTQGVHGYIASSTGEEIFRHMVALLLLGECVYPPTIITPIEPLTEEGSEFAQTHDLTGRELQVVQLVAAGYANKEIGRTLGIGEATAKIHVRSIMRKVSVHNRTLLALWAERHKLAPDLSKPSNGACNDESPNV